MKTTIVAAMMLIFAISISASPQANQQLPYSGADRIMMDMPEEMSRSTSSIADYINSNLTTALDKSRAIFFWIASNITYDSSCKKRYESGKINKDDNLNAILATRRGICHCYTVLFSDIAGKVGVTTFRVIGYTRNPSDKSLFEKHAWICSKVESGWILIDPTWGAARTSKGRISVNDNYFNVSPQKMISTHIPFDPIWQLTVYPVSYDEFASSITQSQMRDYQINFNDSIESMLKKDDIDRLIATNGRMKGQNLSNILVKDEYEVNRRNIIVMGNNQIIAVLNQSNGLTNKAIASYNIHIGYYNRRYTPEIEKDEVMLQLSSILSYIDESSNTLYTLKGRTLKPEHAADIANILSLNHKIKENTEKHIAFANRYYKTNRWFRKLLFFRKRQNADG